MHAPLDNQTRHFNRLREALAEQFGLEADDEAVIDTADGETDLAGLLVHMVRQARERVAQAEVCAEQIKALAARKSRHAAAADKLRALVADAMLDTGLKRLAPGDFTCTVRLSKPGPEIVDSDALPDFYWKQKIEVVPDKEAIKSEFERCAAEGAEFSIAGVAVSNGKPILTVRV
jgi:Siphovirus Gp157